MSKNHIIIDPIGDYDVDWRKRLWKKSWSNTHIPKKLRGKIEVIFNKKDGSPIIRKIN